MAPEFIFETETSYRPHHERHQTIFRRQQLVSFLPYHFRVGYCLVKKVVALRREGGRKVRQNL